jgi:DNA-binding CsgD family transcriptional regulator/tetratricopeptide (TPR) repeat protein
MVPNLAQVGAERFVGRKDELAALFESFERAATARTTVVAVSGEAGIGKSRLVRELCDRVAPRAETNAVGHCLEMVRTPFFPFAEVFHKLGLDLGFDVTQVTEPAARGRTQSEKHLRRLQSMARSLLDASLKKPLVLVIEDAHWADAATLGLLEHLIISQTHSRLMVILTVRSEAIERGGAFARVLSRLRNVGLVTIRLGALARAEIATLLHSAAPKPLPRQAVERIKALSEGNPLFAGELLRATLDDDGQIVRQPAYASIRATVIDRFYQLRERDQHVLVCASVVGRFFDLQLVSELADRSLDETLTAFRRARNAQLVHEVTNGSATTIAFRHAVFSEIIYHELLELEARGLHAQIATYLERAADGDRLAEIAYHWSRAKNREKALDYNIRAGDNAMRLTAFEDAARCYDEAITYVGSGSVAYAELAEKRAYAWYSAGVAEDTGSLFSDALSAYEKIGRREKVVEMLLFLSRQAWNDAETAEGYRHATRAAQLIGDANPSLRDYAMTMAASYAAHLGEIGEVERITDTAAIVRVHRGRADDALRLCLQAQEGAQQSGDVDVLVRVYSNSADIYAACGRRREAADLWHRAYAAAEAGGYIGRMAYAALGYAAALLDCGDTARANALYNIAIETGVTNASVAIQASAVGALLHLFVDAAPPVFLEADAALELALRSKEPIRIGQLAAAIVFAHVAGNRADQAAETLERSIGALETPVFAELLLLMGAAYGNSSTKSRAHALFDALPPDGMQAVGILCKDAALALRLAPARRNAALQAISNKAALLPYVLLQLTLLEICNDAVALRTVADSIGAAAYARRLSSIGGRISLRRPTFTRRERQVAELLAEQESNRSIAERLGLSERTVEHHVAAVLARLDIRSRWLITRDLITRLT